MSAKVKNFFIALSLANLFVIAEWFNLLFPSKVEFFAQGLNLNGSVAILLIIAFSTALFFFMIQKADTSTGRWTRPLIYLGLILVFLLAVNGVRIVTNVSANYPIFSTDHFLGNWGGGGNKVKLGLVACCGVFFYLRWSRWWVPLFKNSLVLLSLVPLITLGKVALSGIENSSFGLRPSVAAATGVGLPKRKRIVWMVYDEMDQYYSFPGRPESVRLPAFDQLKRESFSATNAYPPSNTTLSSMPAYLLGKFVSDAAPLNKNDLELTLCGETEKKHWSQEPNVFTEARKLGVKSAVVGWYLPYCRSLKANLDACSWEGGFQFKYEGGVLANMGSILLRAVGSKENLNQLHGNVYRTVLENAKKAVADPELNLILVHWPVPHHPGIPGSPDRHFSYPESEPVEAYFSNLMLADDSLRSLRGQMERAGDWADTTVIVTSDHFWRFVSAGFRAKHELSHHYQVPFFVKLAGHHEGVNFGGEFNTIILHDLILSILKGEVGAPSELALWLNKRKSDQASQGVRRLGTSLTSEWTCGAPSHEAEAPSKQAVVKF